MNGNETIKSAIDRACEINKWVAPRSELQALVNICNKQRRLNEPDLAKMINWFINDQFNEHDSMEKTLTDFYNYLNAEAQ